MNADRHFSFPISNVWSGKLQQMYSEAVHLISLLTNSNYHLIIAHVKIIVLSFLFMTLGCLEDNKANAKKLPQEEQYPLKVRKFQNNLGK